MMKKAHEGEKVTLTSSFTLQSKLQLKDLLQDQVSIGQKNITFIALRSGSIVTNKVVEWGYDTKKTVPKLTVNKQQLLISSFGKVSGDYK